MHITTEMEANELKQRLASESQIKNLRDELASVQESFANEKQELESLKRKRHDEDSAQMMKISKLTNMLKQTQESMQEFLDPKKCSKTNDEIKSALDSPAMPPAMPVAT